jgi:hypothetical protein
MLPYPQIDPVAVALGPLKIHWYGLMYLVGIGGAWLLASGDGGPDASVANLWQYGGFFPNGVVGLVMALAVIMFSFGGLELVGITAAEAANPNGEATWEDLQPVDTLGLEVGYRLIQLVDKDRGGDLLNRIKGVRRKFAQEVGFLPPSVHIKDNLELRPSFYRITLRGAVVGEGE